jgi:hypothetical protein
VDFHQLVDDHATLRSPPAAALRRTDRLLQLTFLGGAAFAADDPGERLDVVIGEGFPAPVHRGASGVLDAVRRDDVHDFEQHAATPSFLRYELCNEQVEQFLAVKTRLEDEVEDTRRALAGEIEQAAFVSVAVVSAKLLTLRRRALPVRRALEELTSRKTVLVSEATLTFLAAMIQTLERLLSDIAADREILETALNLSLTVMSHRTNQTMNRLAPRLHLFLGALGRHHGGGLRVPSPVATALSEGEPGQWHFLSDDPGGERLVSRVGLKRVKPTWSALACFGLPLDRSRGPPPSCRSSRYEFLRLIHTRGSPSSSLTVA